MNIDGADLSGEIVVSFIWVVTLTCLTIAHASEAQFPGFTDTDSSNKWDWLMLQS